jgi:hypothetical protein
MTMDPKHVVEIIKSHLEYLMKPERYVGYRDLLLCELSNEAVYIDTVMFIGRNQPRFIWTDPLEQNEHNSWYGFPVVNKFNLEKEMMLATDDKNNLLEHRMKAESDSYGNRSVFEAASEGKNVQLVLRPGLLTRGRFELESHTIWGRRMDFWHFCDWEKILWLRPIHVLVFESFKPPIEQSTIGDEGFVPAD